MRVWGGLEIGSKQSACGSSDLLDHAVGEYLAGEASLSELAKRTGLDVPTIMYAVAKVTGEDKRAVEGFLSAVKALSEVNKDPEFYTLAVKTIT
jgi:hypothetical protein